MLASAIGYALALLLGIWACRKMHRWVQSAAGARTLGSWPIVIFLQVQILIAVSWVAAFLFATWILWWTERWFGPVAWSLVRALYVLFLLMTPVAVIVIGNSWLRIHPLPESWSLGRIIWGSVAAIGIGMATILWGFDITGAVIFYVSILGLLFLTRWWLLSHPKQNADTRSIPTA